MKYKAFLFDLNGTMVNDMPYHVQAWYRILNHLGANISMEQMKEECYGKNHELIERIFPGRFSEEEKETMSIEKETQYREHFRPNLRLIPGLSTFLQKSAAENIKMAIGSAAIMSNIDFVIDNCNIRQYFDALVSADDVQQSKPHPETFLECARRLHMLPADCIVFEDSPKGVETAANAGMGAVVITTIHTRHDFLQYQNVIRFIDTFNGLTPQEF
jgi:beta-phosphoglucomutase family hydrolase